MSEVIRPFRADHLPPFPQVGQILKEIDRDAIAIFWVAVTALPVHGLGFGLPTHCGRASPTTCAKSRRSACLRGPVYARR